MIMIQTNKMYMKSIFLIGFLLMSMCNYSYTMSFESEQDPLRSRLSSSCVQMAEGKTKITAKLRARLDKVYENIKDAKVEFYSVSDTSEVLLGESVTNISGEAFLLMDDVSHLPKDEDGYYVVSVVYDGDDSYKGSDSEALFKPAKIEMSLEEVDSIKTVTITAFEVGDEEDIPLEDFEVLIQVPRMFSNLTLGSEYTDEDGMIEFEFPNDLPGNEGGGLEIIARILDTDDYGTLEISENMEWGTPLLIADDTVQRELWSPNAPMWMVITFAVLMTLSWGHFFIIIYKLYLVNKEGKLLTST